MTLLLASALLATNATPRELVMSCRAMIPADVELTGRIIMRNRRGVVQKEHAYVYTRQNGVPALTLDGTPVPLDTSPSPTLSTSTSTSTSFSPSPSLLGTDVTVSDLTLDYLWWDDISFDGEREGETVNGQVCSVVVIRKGERTVRVWVDRKTGAMMQAEEMSGDRPVRRLWGTRLKKFDDRWMANVMEVETLGFGHRTKITVETLK